MLPWSGRRYWPILFLLVLLFFTSLYSASHTRDPVYQGWKLSTESLALLSTTTDEVLLTLLREEGGESIETSYDRLTRGFTAGGELDWLQREIEVEAKAGVIDQSLDYYAEQLVECLPEGDVELLSRQEDLGVEMRELHYDLGLRVPEDLLTGEERELITHRLTLRTETFLPGQRGRMAVVIDDVGYFRPGFEQLLDLPRPVTAAVLPGRPGTRAQVDRLREHRIPYMLHLPMDPSDPEIDPFGAVMVGDCEERIAATVRDGLDEVHGAIGINNHMGSRATADEEVMQAVLEVVRQKGLFFMDSSTTDRSVVYRVGRQVGVPVVINNLFLDNKRSEDYVRKQIGELIEIAVETGKAVGIGHVHPATLMAIEASIPRVEAQGIEFVYLHELLPEDDPYPVSY